MKLFSLQKRVSEIARKMFYEIDSWFKHIMTSFRGQVSWAKIGSPGGKLTVLACKSTKRVNNAEELT